MGLIKAALQAAGSTLHDQWKDYIRCEDLGNDILMKRVSTPNGIISKSSAIQVSPGQIAVIFQNGKILDATAEEGYYTFDESASPTFFAGDFGDVFKEMWNRFTYNGGVSKEQVVFYLNGKEIIDNKFGTPAPIPFQDWSHPIPNQMTNSVTPLRVDVKCFGKYTFKITDPAIFMSKIAGTADEYKKDTLIEQMRSEVIASFQNVLNELGTSAHKVYYLVGLCLMRRNCPEQCFGNHHIERGGNTLARYVAYAEEQFLIPDKEIKQVAAHLLGRSESSEYVYVIAFRVGRVYLWYHCHLNGTCYLKLTLNTLLLLVQFLILYLFLGNST